MKRIFFTFILAGLLVGCKENCTFDANMTQIIAHRGYWNTEGSAQNTIKALDLAIENCFYGSECDAGLFADGYYMFHDNNINGIYNYTRTYAEISADTTIANGEKIPSVEEYLKFFKKNTKGTKLIFEMKPEQTPELRTKSVETFAELINKYQLANMVELISFDIEMCRAVAAIFPQIPVAYLEGNMGIPLEELKAMGVDGIDYHYSFFLKDPNLVAKAHALGMYVNVWTVNKPELAQELIDMNVDFITTDTPVEIAALIK